MTVKVQGDTLGKKYEWSEVGGQGVNSASGSKVAKEKMKMC